MALDESREIYCAKKRKRVVSKAKVRMRTRRQGGGSEIARRDETSAESCKLGTCFSGAAESEWQVGVLPGTGRAHCKLGGVFSAYPVTAGAVSARVWTPPCFSHLVTNLTGNFFSNASRRARETKQPQKQA
jgi:hypothetical protein